MAWLQATIDAESTVAERLADALMDAGALSTAIEDAFAGTEREEPIFGEPGEPVDKLWSRSRIITLFDEAADVALLIAAAATACELTLPGYSVERVEEQDWVRLTQSQFDPIRISDRLWITPTWHEPPAPNAVNLQLDRAWPSAPAPPHHPLVPAMAGCPTAGRRKRAGLRLRFRHPRHRRAEAGRGLCLGAWTSIRKRCAPAMTMPSRTR